MLPKRVYYSLMILYGLIAAGAGAVNIYTSGVSTGASMGLVGGASVALLMISRWHSDSRAGATMTVFDWASLLAAGAVLGLWVASLFGLGSTALDGF